MARPTIAADPADRAAQRRSLVLAGGGMRVAYQAGVVAALDEAGLRFHHVDGSSGGTMNTSMILAGVAPAEACERWRSLNPRHFAAPLPWSDYLRSPHWPALGGGRGLREKVFPHLGIDAGAIRAATGMAGTYNVANFATKRAEVFEHTDVDEDLLVAAVSLPVLMPAVTRAGSAYTDAVWLRDSNVPEAVRRGSDDIWLVWCIGNTPAYHDGAFRQYVHMIELAANGSLLSDLDQLALTGPAGLRLHVIKPARPLPLDPDYFLGRVDGATLVDWGYQDARRYLANPQPLSAPWGPDVTRMLAPVAGASLRLCLEGPWAPGCEDPDAGAERGRQHGTTVGLRLRVDSAGGSSQLSVAGDVTVPGWCRRALVAEGRAGPALDFELALGGGFRLRTRRHRGGLAVTMERQGNGQVVGAGMAPFGPAQAAAATATIRPTNPSSLTDAWRARAGMARIVWRAAGW